jgi:phosphoglycerate-specific signal transduction histidine kinase
MDGGTIDVRRLEEQLSKLEKLAEELESVPDSGVVDILDQALVLLAEVNTRVEAGLASTESEVRELGDLLEKIDFGPFDAVLENLERPSGGPGGG